MYTCWIVLLLPAADLVRSASAISSVSAHHALPRYQHASRLIAAIKRQPLMGPDPPSAGGVARPFGPALLLFP
jgi:hypothetical protein